jgi:hypothetical protein
MVGRIRLPPRKDVHILTPASYEYNLTWQKGLFRCDEVMGNCAGLLRWV